MRSATPFTDELVPLGVPPPGCSQSLARVSLEPGVVSSAKATLRREAAEVGAHALCVCMCVHVQGVVPAGWQRGKGANLRLPKLRFPPHQQCAWGPPRPC